MEASVVMSGLTFSQFVTEARNIVEDLQAEVATLQADLESVAEGLQTEVAIINRLVGHPQDEVADLKERCAAVQEGS